MARQRTPGAQSFFTILSRRSGRSKNLVRYGLFLIEEMGKRLQRKKKLDSIRTVSDWQKTDNIYGSKLVLAIVFFQ